MIRGVITYRGNNLAPNSQAYEMHQNAKKPEDWKKLDEHLRQVEKTERLRQGTL